MEFIKKGFYNELHQLISKIIIEKDGPQVIVDTEGSYKKLVEQYKNLIMEVCK